MTNDMTFKYGTAFTTMVFLLILGLLTVGYSEEFTPLLVDAPSKPSLEAPKTSDVSNASDKLGPPKPEVIAKQISTKSGLAIKLIVKLAPSWHITSHNPKDEFAFGAEIEFKNPDFEPGAIQWPMPVVKYIESIGVENSYYEGEFEILIPLDQFPKQIQGEEVVFHYQTCTEKLCLAPNFMSTLIW